MGSPSPGPHAQVLQEQLHCPIPTVWKKLERGPGMTLPEWTFKNITFNHINQKKPALTRVQRPMPATIL